MATKTATKKPATKKPARSRAKPATEVVAENATKPTAEAIRNHFILLLDSSGSMRPHAEGAKKIVNQNINAIRGETIKRGQDSTVTVGTFGGDVKFKHRVAKMDDLRVFSDYYPTGGTPMLRAIHEAIDVVESEVKDSASDSYLLMVITDGEDTDGDRYNGQRLPERVARLQATDRWSVVFLVPSDSYKKTLCVRYGIPLGNVEVWEQSADGMERASASIARGISSYVADRASGKRSTTKFFETDASNISKRDLNKCVDLAGEAKILEVKAECVIREFVERELGSYRVGSAFYELTKDETIQRYKKVAIMERGGRKIYGGDDARALLNMPNEDVRVKIGNHGTYRIFVQSTSVNRKLVRGTKLLVIPSLA
jgi:hypothetical protein